MTEEKKNKITICVGIPCSGKSTYAKLIANNPKNNTIRVNRDDIRKSVGKYWVPKREPFITEVEEGMIYHALENEYNVIIDATNIGKKAEARWKNLFDHLIGDMGYQFEVEYKYFPISLNKALFRNWKRNLFLPKDERISSDIVKGFYKRYIKEYDS